MNKLKTRFLALVIIAIFAVTIYLSWRQLLQEGRYSVKMAAFGPVGLIGGLFLLFFPTMWGKPKTAREKILVLLVLVIGLVGGLLNWYLMDPSFFGR
jgi:hypothetical protein